MKEGIQAAANWLVDTAKEFSGEAAAEAVKEEAAQQTAKNFIEQVTSNNNAETLAGLIKDVMTPETVTETTEMLKETVKEMVQQPSTSAVQSVVDGITENANEVKENLENLVRESDTSSWCGYIWDGMTTTLGKVVTAGGTTVAGGALWFWGTKSTKDMLARVEKSLKDNKPLFEMIKSSADMFKAVDKMKDKDFALTALNALTPEQTKTLAAEGKLLGRLTELAKAKDELEFQSKLLAYKVIEKLTPETESEPESESDESGLGLDTTDSVPPVVKPVVEPVVIEPAQAAVTDEEIKASIATLQLGDVRAAELLEKVKKVLERGDYSEHARVVFNIIQKNDSAILRRIDASPDITQSKFEQNVSQRIKADPDFVAATKPATRPKM